MAAIMEEIIEGIVECIDDEGAVAEEDTAILVRRIKAAVKFVGNLND